MSTLYRTYRPQVFAELRGQDHITAVLKQAILKNKVAHAYLFYGPRGTGKTTTARILAKRLNCTKAKDAEPCGKCPTCIATQEQRNIDLLEIDAASNRGIDDIRALKEGINLSPSMSTYKIYIIDEVHMLTNEAFTALLKTLEEPTAHAIFILATTELHKVPETILSRCQVFRFRRATDAELRDRLTYLLQQEKREANPDALQFIISRSDGCFRDAESLLGQMLSLHEEAITLPDVTTFLGLPPQEHLDTFLQALVRGESAPAIASLEQVFAEGYDPEQFTKEAITTARNAAVAIVKKEATLWQFSQEPQALARLPLVIRALLQAIMDLAYVPQPLIALHLATLTLCTKPGAGTIATPRTSSAVPLVVKQQVVTQATTLTVSTPTVTPATPIGSVAKVTQLWPQLIDAIRAKNPVAATFLRAMEPGSWEGNQVVIKAQYALHKNFFTKPTNEKLLAETLSRVLSTTVNVRCVLEDATAPTPSGQPEEELLNAVKEVFS